MTASSTIAAEPTVDRPGLTRRLSRRIALAVALGGAVSCGASPASPPGSGPPAGSATPSASAVAPSPTGPRTRFPLVDAPDTPVPVALQPVPGGASLLIVSQFAGEAAARLRRLDGATGALGPLIELPGEQVYGAFDGVDGTFALVTSNGQDLCVASYRAGDAEPAARGCATIAPATIVALGDRLAALELVTAPPPVTTSAKPPAPPPAARPEKKSPARRPDPGKTGKKPGATKDLKKKKPTHATATRPTRLPSELRLRWITRAGVFDSDTQATGLHFMAPMDGLALLGARARGAGVDLAWYETAPARKSRSGLGSARLMAGSLKADGALDLASRVAVIDADLEYGGLKDHHAPRLAGDASSTVYLDVDAKGQLEAARVLPTLGRLAPVPAEVAVDPDRALTASPAELAIFTTLLGEKPCRVAGQPPREPGAVVWAGERGYFQKGAVLRSAARADGVIRDEPAPLQAPRARLAWGALFADGEGLAFAGDHVVHVDRAGAIQRSDLPAPLATSAADPSSAALPAGLLRAADLPADRRHVARIGATTWLARGDLVRLTPTVLAPPALRGQAPEGASVLVSGLHRGLLLGVASGALTVRALDEAGALTRLVAGALVSPVRPGLDASERAAGGAIVAGVSAADPSRVVTFAVDADGHVGREQPAPLPIKAGELAVRVTALPGGGAWLTDLDRRTVVWLDDDAHPRASAPWPTDESAALCLDGRPARKSIPSVDPGHFVTIPDLATPGTCVVGEPTWTDDGRLLWLGTSVKGLRSTPELGVVTASRPASAIAASPSIEAACAAAPTPVCPGDMVSIAGRYCVDRFEATLVDAITLSPLSPDYPSTPNLLDFVLAEWSTGRERLGNVHARALPLPWLSPARIGQKPTPLAVSRPGARPSGYVTGVVAESACSAAGKRLCTLDEFVMACRGEGDTLFPYGDSYQDGVCNVFRDDHPAAILHGNASIGHLDPRLNRVSGHGKPLFQPTGQSLACRSKWGSDAIYDMVGNLDEWIEEGNGAFAGGFYSRSTRAGCEALITAHPRSYLDYSTGVRCCKAASPSAP